MPDPDPRKVGLVLEDGTHLVLDADDPRAAAFVALAERLND